MKDEEFILFQDFLEKKSGLHFDQSKMESLKASLLQRMQVNQLDNFEHYYRFLAFHPEGEKELRNLLSLITINETSFFRQKEQFIVLEEKVLPELIREKEKRDAHLKGIFSLDIWSAGCASGEEPYTIALILKEKFSELQNWNINILGTDIDQETLEQAKKGIYGRNSLRSTEPEYRKKYFTKIENRYLLKEEIKKMVSFAYHNLAGESYPSPQLAGGAHHSGAHHSGTYRKWDIIFCRNVLIYFKPEKIENILDHFYRHIQDNGCLFLGYAESIGRFSQFTLIQRDNTFYYQKEVSKEVLTSEVTVSKDDSFTQQIPSPIVSSKASGEKSGGKTRVSVVKLPKEGDSLEVKTEKLYQEILQLLDREEYDFALKKIDELMKMDKFLPEGYYLRGVIEDKLNHSEEAIAEFKRTIYLDKNFLMAHFNLAEIYVRMGRKKDALRKYNNALSILEDREIEDPIPFSGGFGKKVLINLCERYIQRLNPNKEKEKIPGIAPG